jgi:hypothetical protein
MATKKEMRKHERSESRADERRESKSYEAAERKYGIEKHGKRGK